MDDTLLVKYSAMVDAIAAEDTERIIAAFKDLGIRVVNEADKSSVEKMAITMLDTRVVPGYILDPFDPENSLKDNSVTKLPPDLYFVVRTVQLFRGIAHAFEIDYSVANVWRPHAKRILSEMKISRTR